MSRLEKILLYALRDAHWWLLRYNREAALKAIEEGLKAAEPPDDSTAEQK